MIGIVEDNNDPLHKGRIKVRIYGLTDQKNGDDYAIHTEFLPWAWPNVLTQAGSSSGAGCFSVPKIGTKVRVTGTVDAPIWEGMMYVSDEVSAELSSTNGSNAHILIYDTDMSLGEGQWSGGEYIKVYFTEDKGLVIDYKNAHGRSKFTMDPEGCVMMEDHNGDTISLNNGTIEIKSDCEITINSPSIKLGEKAVEGLLKGDAFKKIFDNHKHFVDGKLSEGPIPKLLPAAISDNVKI